MQEGIKHALGPYYISRYRDNNEAVKYSITVLKDGKHHFIGNDFELEDAEFIVRACNSHYELLDIVKETRKDIDIDRQRTEPGFNRDIYNEWIAEIDATIAKAEGK